MKTDEKSLDNQRWTGNIGGVFTISVTNTALPVFASKSDPSAASEKTKKG